MVFPSVAFLFYFFPLFLACYVLLPFRNLTIISFSLLFYFWGENYYILLLLFSVLLNYICGRFIASDNRRISKFWLFTGIGANLLILGYYKYFGFVMRDVLGMALPEHRTPILPLGISFFTFQAVSYLVDVYRREAENARSFLDLTLYITMFPQLIAGPIVRYASVSRNIKHRVVLQRHILHGVMIFVLGLSMKVLIANTMAVTADGIYNLDPNRISTQLAWVGSTAYMLQIYFDFAGYSNMAIGIGLMMGFRFPRNFNYPYISQSITEFWQRWHISLSSWFKDYLYIPLGGNRNGQLTTYRNLLIVFLLCGLWHGAAWTFVAWGLYHGLLLIIERLGFHRILDRIPACGRTAYTLLAVLVGWILFRAESFDQAGLFITALFGSHHAVDTPTVHEFVSYETICFAIIGMICATPAVKKLFNKLIYLPEHVGDNTVLSPAIKMSTWGLACGLYLFSITYIASGAYNPFIYFRF